MLKHMSFLSGSAAETNKDVANTEFMVCYGFICVGSPPDQRRQEQIERRFTKRGPVEEMRIAVVGFFHSCAQKSSE